MLLFFTALTITGNRYSNEPSNALGIGFVIVFWMHGLSFALAWSGLLVAYTVEILPYKLRAKGITVMNLSLQIAMTINNYVNPLAISRGKPWESDPWKLYAIYTVWIAFELAFVYFVYPETRYVVSSSSLSKYRTDFLQAAQLLKRLSKSLTARRRKSASRKTRRWMR